MSTNIKCLLVKQKLEALLDIAFKALKEFNEEIKKYNKLICDKINDLDFEDTTCYLLFEC